MVQSPCYFCSPCWAPCIPFTYLETLLAVTGFVHLGLRLLVNWPPLPQPFPIPSPFQIPSTQVKYAPHYDDFKDLASLVRNSYVMQGFLGDGPSNHSITMVDNIITMCRVNTKCTSEHHTSIINTTFIFYTLLSYDLEWLKNCPIFQPICTIKTRVIQAGVNTSSLVFGKNLQTKSSLKK